ncbi:DnaB-like helicase N-terminal domain-containing protein [Sulfuricurvum sp.]|uniref:DnaB-like helicase N-terminal domain-containing protein n=1 Tax=Sulfuricurvum sp. TaxID=2025608 RepID=UPI002E308089|nr:DnaB-like helicase N-terminal domain-containing protein [Sulfuricurvum sp.]HEX5330806.1 DnaB-like helicase N-terminal domain-containing protein [Sulfuricurvum sp.]
MEEHLYNLAFERSVLSSIIFINYHDADNLDEMVGMLDENLFYLQAHKNICAAILKLHSSGLPIEESFIQKNLVALGQFDERTMIEVLTTNSIANIKPYIDEMVDKARKRKLLELTTKIKSMVFEENNSADDIDAMLELEMSESIIKSGMTMPITMEKAIEEFHTMKIPEPIRTGIEALDNLLCGGFEPAQLVHIGGERNVGKTTLMKQILFNTSTDNDTLFFSFEMPKWKMAKYTERMRGKSNMKRYHIIDTNMMKSRDVTDVARMIRTMWRKHGIRFALIDSKMKLNHRSYKGNSDAEKKGEIDSILSAVTQETGIVILMIVQASREELKSGKMGSYGSVLSDYETDMQLLLKKTEGGIEVSCEKNRQKVLHYPAKLWFNKEELKFDSIKTGIVTYQTPSSYTDRSSLIAGNDEKVEIMVL